MRGKRWSAWLGTLAGLLILCGGQVFAAETGSEVLEEIPDERIPVCTEHLLQAAAPGSSSAAETGSEVLEEIPDERVPVCTEHLLQAAAPGSSSAAGTGSEVLEEIPDERIPVCTEHLLQTAAPVPSLLTETDSEILEEIPDERVPVKAPVAVMERTEESSPRLGSILGIAAAVLVIGAVAGAGLWRKRARQPENMEK